MGDIITLEVREIYKGWICSYDPDTDEITWRDILPVKKLSTEEKQRIEERFRRHLNMKNT